VAEAIRTGPGNMPRFSRNLTNAQVTNGVMNSYTINSAPLVIDAFNRAAQIITQDYDAKLTYKGDNFDLTANAGDTRATGGTQHQFFGEYFVFANANVTESKDSSAFTVTGVPGVDPNATNLNSGADFGAAGEPSFDYGNIASNPEVDDEKWIQVDATVPLKGVLKNFQAGLRFSDHKAGENGNVVSVPNADAVVTPLSALGVSAAPSNYLSGPCPSTSCRTPTAAWPASSGTFPRATARPCCSILTRSPRRTKLSSPPPPRSRSTSASRLDTSRRTSAMDPSRATLARASSRRPRPAPATT